MFTGSGRLQKRQVKLNINLEVKPTAQAVRCTPFGLRENIEVKIMEFIDKDITEPVEEPIPWVSPVVVVHKAYVWVHMFMHRHMLSQQSSDARRIPNLYNRRDITGDDPKLSVLQIRLQVGVPPIKDTPRLTKNHICDPH